MMLEFETPRVPNFIRVKGEPELVSIGRLTEEELTEYAELWCETLRVEAERKRTKARGRTK